MSKRNGCPSVRRQVAPARNAGRAGSALLLLFILSPLNSAGQSARPDLPPPPSPLEAQKNERPYAPITRRERLHWFVDETAGPEHVALGLASAGLGTAEDDPPEYQGTWSGFAKRLGVRESGISLSNAMEASLGSLWGEDPRYFPLPRESFGRRLGNVIKQTFFAKYADGSFRPAYARYTAIAGNNFISNTWRVPSEASSGDAITRTTWGFLARMASNAYGEFWPDVRRRFLHRR